MVTLNHEKVLETIKTFRERKNLSQRDVADKMGISQQTYANYENGKSDTTVEFLAEAQRALKIPFAELITGETDKEKLLPLMKEMAGELSTRIGLYKES